MRLQRLELVGFKSFMNKTVLTFEDGVTAIVGPNGCGKSNIVDAIFWVMGDQSPKHLRGTDMGDIIFAGSDSQPPAGMSEVTLTLSTEDGGLPAQYNQFSEVSVSRRLYRSGESEYLINKTPCRLKDVVELFMDTGMGAKSYAIIEQGHIDKIVGQKAPERRGFIEEAAGIMKFKSRRREAELKISGAEQNLLRINDIIGELKRQINSLERQARKAERYKKIKEQIRDIELTVMSQEFVASVEALGTIQEKLQTQKATYDASTSDIKRVESFLEKLKLKLAEMETALQSSQQAVYQTQQQIQQLESQKEIKSKEIENWKSHEMKDETDIKGLQEKEAQLEKSKGNIDQGLRDSEQEAATLKEKLAKGEQELESELRKQEVLKEKIETCKAELVSILTEAAECKKTISTLEEQKESTEHDKEQLADEAHELVAKRTAVEQQKKAIEESISKVETDRQELLIDKEENEKRVETLKNELETKTKELEGVREDHQKISARLDSLTEIQKNFEGYEAGAKALLSASDESVNIQGILADVIETDKQYEQAVEAALRGKLQYLLVANREEALKAIDYLTQNEAGLSHFVMTDRVDSIPIDRLEEPSFEPLWTKIRVRSPYENIIQHLLKDTYLVRDFTSALEKWDAHPGKYAFVTLEGAIVNSLGIIYGGKSSKDAEAGFLARKREIKELEEQKSAVSQTLSSCEENIHQTQASIEKASVQIQAIGEALHRQEVSETSFKKDITQCDVDLERLSEEMDGVREQQEDLSAKVQEYKAELSSEKNREQLLTDKREAQEGALQTAQATYKKVEAGIEAQQKVVTGLKVAEASLTEKKEALQRQKDHFLQNLKTLLEEISEKREAVKLAQERQAAITEEIKEDHKKLELEIKELEIAKQKLSELQTSFDQEQQRCRVLEEGLRKERSQFHKMETEMHENELKISQHEMSLKHLAEQAKERYMIDLEIMADRYKDREITDEDRKLLAILKEKAARMGEVNLMALEEFDELKQRFENLEKQKGDLLKSMESLKKTIEKINRICRTRFKETFEAVNKNFKRIFPILFGGGKAELQLTDENDILESGVEIMAKPPGKKSQNINLLSGGEKALTAVSLIFSVFLMKPSPFCLLDEVDAPLDDANVGRFNEMIRQMTNKSQFVVITHNKKTMSASDVLYGVTMEKPGISTMVSVMLDKAIEIAHRTPKSPSKPKPVASA